YMDPSSGQLKYIKKDKSKLCVNLLDAVELGMIESDGCIVDPVTKERMTLVEAVTASLIDSDSITVSVNDKVMSLKQALAEGIIDPLSGEVTLPSTGATISLIEAINKGLVSEGVTAQGSHSMTMQQALEQGLFIEDTGKVLDQMTGKKLKLNE